MGHHRRQEQVRQVVRGGVAPSGTSAPFAFRPSVGTWLQPVPAAVEDKAEAVDVVTIVEGEKSSTTARFGFKSYKVYRNGVGVDTELFKINEAALDTSYLTLQSGVSAKDAFVAGVFYEHIRDKTKNVRINWMYDVDKGLVKYVQDGMNAFKEHSSSINVSQKGSNLEITIPESIYKEYGLPGDSTPTSEPSDTTASSSGASEASKGSIAPAVETEKKLINQSLLGIDCWATYLRSEPVRGSSLISNAVYAFGQRGDPRTFELHVHGAIEASPLYDENAFLIGIFSAATYPGTNLYLTRCRSSSYKVPYKEGRDAFQMHKDKIKIKSIYDHERRCTFTHIFIPYDVYSKYWLPSYIFPGDSFESIAPEALVISGICVRANPHEYTIETLDLGQYCNLTFKENNFALKECESDIRAFLAGIVAGYHLMQNNQELGRVNLEDKLREYFDKGLAAFKEDNSIAKKVSDQKITLDVPAEVYERYGVTIPDNWKSRFQPPEPKGLMIEPMDIPWTSEDEAQARRVTGRGNM